MSGFMRSYICVVDGFNRRLGRFTMYGIFVLVGILLWSSITKTFFTVPSRWTLEMAQFAMVAYYILGGPYSIQMGSNVRMDLFYGDWSARRKAWFDAVTVFCLIGFLLVSRTSCVFAGRRSDVLRMIAILMFSSMMLMLLTGQRVFGAIGFVAVVAALLAVGRRRFDIPFSAAMKLMKWYPLLTLPMFIFMGYVLSESKIADDLYKMFHVWMGPVHGGLAIGTIG
jgi:TRAP-type C4-dicarboxylate transport system permease small subunit